jgi:hypothetical protein
MAEKRVRRSADPIMLPGQRVRYGNSEIVDAPSFDLEEVLGDFVHLGKNARAEFLSIFAHSLTVEIRVALHDRPVANHDAEQAYEVNEWLHQLTSCLSPASRRDAHGEAELLRNIAIDGLRHGLPRAVARAVTAAKNAIVRATQSAAAIDG